MIKYLQYFFLTPMLFFLVACNTTKGPTKEEVESNTSTSTNTASQVEVKEKKTVLEKELEKYLKELSDFNTDAIVDMTYPKLFYVIDLDLFRQYIASMMNSTDIKMTSYKSNVTKISEVTTFSNDTQFAQVHFTSMVTIRFLNNAMYDSKEKLTFLYDALVHKYGIDNIQVDLEERILSIKKPEKLLMIKEKDTQWKFLGDNSKYRQLYPGFLPNEILRIIE